MIFISHNKKDKPVVEPIAIKLAEIFGQDNIFYDSWSIQPGDGIIDKMNEGLSKCKFFFYFVSANSLNSSMVKMEWQNASDIVHRFVLIWNGRGSSTNG